MCKPGCINALKSSMLLPIRKCLVNVMMLLCILILCRVFMGHDRLKFGCMDSACGPGTKIYMIPFSKYMRLNRTLEQFKSLRPSPFNSWPRRWKSCFSANRAGLKHWSNGMATPNSVLWQDIWQKCRLLLLIYPLVTMAFHSLLALPFDNWQLDFCEGVLSSGILSHQMEDPYHPILSVLSIIGQSISYHFPWSWWHFTFSIIFTQPLNHSISKKKKKTCSSPIYCCQQFNKSYPQLCYL